MGEHLRKSLSLFVRWEVFWKEPAESRGGKRRRAEEKDPTKPYFLNPSIFRGSNNNNSDFINYDKD